MVRPAGRAASPVRRLSVALTSLFFDDLLTNRRGRQQSRFLHRKVVAAVENRPETVDDQVTSVGNPTLSKIARISLLQRVVRSR